jgi:low temperature requirement protein LtrA
MVRLDSAASFSRWYRPMRARDPEQPHRASTNLELLFDLCFVVAVAVAAGQLHHAIAEGHAREILIGYAQVFFAIWWAWMNFTWFASSYDTDDVPYRLITVVQIAGVLILAAGLPRVFASGDFSIVVFGYVIMRCAMIVQWLRAAGADPARRAAAYRYASGIALCQIGWVARLALPPEVGNVSFLVLALAEIAVPLWAEGAAQTPWHPEHISERYGLFTLIVIGESVLAATTAIQSSLDMGVARSVLLTTAGCGLVIVVALWWLYFDHGAGAERAQRRLPVIWSYGHLPIFAAAAGVGAGLQAAIDTATGAAHIPITAAGLGLAVPIAVYLLGVWALHLTPGRISPIQLLASPLAVIVVLASALSPWPLPLITLCPVARVVVEIVGPQAEESSPHGVAIVSPETGGIVVNDERR